MLSEEVQNSVTAKVLQNLASGLPLRNSIRAALTEAAAAPKAAEKWCSTYYEVELPKGDPRRLKLRYVSKQPEGRVILSVVVEDPAPIYAYRRKGLSNFVTCDKVQYDELSNSKLFEVCKFVQVP